MICGLFKPIDDGTDLSWQRIAHQGGHQRFYLTQQSLLGSV